MVQNCAFTGFVRAPTAKFDGPLRPHPISWYVRGTRESRCLNSVRPRYPADQFHASRSSGLNKICHHTCCRRLLFVTLGLLGLLLGCTRPSPPYDLILQGATVFDGTGAPGTSADVAIAGDRIAAIEPGIDPNQGHRVLSVEGLFLAPGFIDSHAHTSNLADFPDAENFLRQGITTTMATLHSQDPPWPLRATVETLTSTLNIGFFAGHTWARRTTMGTENREPTPAELDAMEELVRTFMEEGALGLSTGLEYIPAVYSKTEEIVVLAKVAADFGGVYTTHMRDEGPGLIASVDETIRIAEEAGLPALINHHKVIGLENVGNSSMSLARIDEARARGVEITHDLYPYTAYSTYSSIAFPPWSLAGGPTELAKRVAEPTSRRRIAEGIKKFLREQAGGTLDTIQFRTFKGNEEWEGRTVQEFVAATQADRGSKDVSLDAGIEILMDLEPQGGFTGICHQRSRPH